MTEEQVKTIQAQLAQISHDIDSLKGDLTVGMFIFWAAGSAFAAGYVNPHISGGFVETMAKWIFFVATWPFAVGLKLGGGL